MSVTFVNGWQIHVVAIDNGTEFHGISGTFESLSFEDDIFVGNENIPAEMLVEPGAVTVHTATLIAEEAAESTENGEDKIVKNVIACLSETRMNTGETEVDIHR